MKLHRLENIELTPEIFSVFRRQPPLLTAGDRESCNTMTIGWCQLGSLWSIPVCTVYVRPERYTYQFMEESRYFTDSVLTEDAGADVLEAVAKWRQWSYYKLKYQEFER